jgi:integrase
MADIQTAGSLIEPSFAEALAAIKAAKDLKEDKRRHRMCSLRIIAKGLGKPPELVPARWTAVRIPISRLHHTQMGVAEKTLANHKGNVRSALSWFANDEHVPLRGAPLTLDWSKLKQGISHYRTSANLSSLMRYCSARDIAPQHVDETVLDALMAYRKNTTALATDAAARRKIARTWNRCIGVVPGWPSQRLVEPPLKSTLSGPTREEFPAGLRKDIETYLSGLSQVRRTAGGRRRAPCKSSTINVRRAKLDAFVRKAVATGVPISSLMSFGQLFDPDLVKRVLDAYWQDSGENPSIYLIELAALVVSIARQTRCIDEGAIDRLDDMRAALDQYRPVDGLTEKNMALIRKILSSDVWRRVVSLPWQLMQEADALRDRAPVKAAVLAQIAVAIGILSVFPIRLGNLGNIQIGENLIRPGGPDTPYWLVFSQYDVKNRIRLETVFDSELTALIDNYIYKHLAVLLRGCNEPWLFPGMCTGHKGLATLSSQITKRIKAATGLRVTVHQFRHAAAALILKAKPGNYEYVRRILAHRNIQTTIKFYVGLETAQATQVFGEIIRREMRFDPSVT